MRGADMSEITSTNKPASGMASVAKFFGMKLTDFRNQWSPSEDYTGPRLTERDKEQLREGIANGSLTY